MRLQVPVEERTPAGWAMIQVLVERARQRDRWAEAHDDGHTPSEWCDLILHYALALNQEIGMGTYDSRLRFAQIGALALAALESMRRQGPGQTT